MSCGNVQVNEALIAAITRAAAQDPTLDPLCAGLTSLRHAPGESAGIVVRAWAWWAFYDVSR